MVETECFRELNVFAENECPTPDLLVNAPPVIEKPGCFPFRRKVGIFFKYILHSTLTYHMYIYYIGR